jgi:hypothetical protein
VRRLLLVLVVVSAATERLPAKKWKGPASAVTMRTLLVSAVSLLVTTGASSAADSDIISGVHDKTPIGEFGARSSRTPEAACLC